MRTITLRANVGEGGRLHLDIPVGLPQGPVDIVLVIQPRKEQSSHDIRELRGLGKEIWQGIDAQKYVRALRDEWER